MITPDKQKVIELLIHAQSILLELPSPQRTATAILLLSLALLRMQEVAGYEEAVTLAEAEIMDHMKQRKDKKDE